MTETAFPSELSLVGGPVAAIDLALFAAASGDHNPLHLDAGVARAAGFDRPVVHGMLTMASVARLFTHRFGAGSVAALDTRFTGVALLGDTLHMSAALTGTEGGCAHYELRVRTASGAEIVTGSARISATITAQRKVA
jgi:acyl dehydratase